MGSQTLTKTYVYNACVFVFLLLDLDTCFRTLKTLKTRYANVSCAYKMSCLLTQTCWVNDLLINHNCCIKLVSRIISCCTTLSFINYCSDMFRPQFLAIFREPLLFFVLDLCSLCVTLFGSSLHIWLTVKLKLKY